MAALDLSGATRAPLPYSMSSVGTTWQEVILPPWCTRVAIDASAAIYVSWTSGITGATEPADGGASGSTTHKIRVAADGGYAQPVNDPDGRPVFPGVTVNRSIFVAAQSGTADINLTVEMGRA